MPSFSRFRSAYVTFVYFIIRAVDRMPLFGYFSSLSASPRVPAQGIDRIRPTY